MKKKSPRTNSLLSWVGSKERGIINFIVYKADNFSMQKGFSIWKFPQADL